MSWKLYKQSTSRSGQLVFQPHGAEGIVHEFLPLTSYLCTVYCVSTHVDCAITLSQEERPQGGQGTYVRMSNCKCCHCAPTTYAPGETFTIAQLSKSDINEFFNAVNAQPPRQPAHSTIARSLSVPTSPISLPYESASPSPTVTVVRQPIRSGGMPQLRT